MGQAKRRGTFEQRKAEGIKKRAVQNEILKAARQKHWDSMPREKKAKVLDLLAAAAFLGADISPLTAPPTRTSPDELNDLPLLLGSDDTSDLEAGGAEHSRDAILQAAKEHVSAFCRSAAPACEDPMPADADAGSGSQQLPATDGCEGDDHQ